MYNIKTMNKISPKGLSLFDSKAFSVSNETDNPDGILVRSASLHDTEFGSNLAAIARAGAGTNNIPIDKCSEQGIVVFNTPGANANAVKELVTAGLLLSSRKIVDGIEWVKTLDGKGDEIPGLVEKGKGQFAGPELEGKTLGVIGLGAIGAMVANTGHDLGMKVYGVDPYLSVDAAWRLSRAVNKASSYSEVFANSDYISIHVPVTNETKHMINSESIATMKNGVRILNFSRAELVNEEDMAAALESGKVACYVTDFPNASVLKMKNTVAIPHLGASTPESEDNCAVMAVNEIMEYLKYGNIRNSVNMPAVELPKNSKVRVCIIHKNVPNILSQISAVFGEAGANIENLINKSRKEIAYSILDITDDLPEGAVRKIQAIQDVIRIRVIH